MDKYKKYEKEINHKIDTCDLKTLERMEKLLEIEIFEDLPEYVTYESRKKANDQLKNYELYRYAMLYIA